MAKSLQTVLGVQGAAFFSVSELSQPDATPESSALAPRTMDQVLQILREEFGYDLEVTVQIAQEEQSTDEQDDVLTTAMGKEMLCNIGNLDVSAAANYLSNYQLSEEQQDCAPAEQKTDCNDSAYRVCSRLEHRKLPMYFLSMWPATTSNRFNPDHSWHQLAACKLADNMYLIFDNGAAATLWHGSLQSYVSTYSASVPQAIIPRFGIARYLKPKHDIALSKWLIHALHGVGSEEEMESLNIPNPQHRHLPVT